MSPKLKNQLTGGCLNEIAHEYKRQTIMEIFERVLLLAPCLMNAVDSIETYCRKYVVSTTKPRGI